MEGVGGWEGKSEGARFLAGGSWLLVYRVADYGSWMFSSRR